MVCGRSLRSLSHQAFSADVARCYILILEEAFSYEKIFNSGFGISITFGEP